MHQPSEPTVFMHHLDGANMLHFFSVGNQFSGRYVFMYLILSCKAWKMSFI